MDNLEEHSIILFNRNYKVFPFLGSVQSKHNLVDFLNDLFLSGTPMLRLYTFAMVQSWGPQKGKADGLTNKFASTQEIQYWLDF